MAQTSDLNSGKSTLRRDLEIRTVSFSLQSDLNSAVQMRTHSPELPLSPLLPVDTRGLLLCALGLGWLGLGFCLFGFGFVFLKHNFTPKTLLENNIF